jgi:hypothetical protein
MLVLNASFYPPILNILFCPLFCHLPDKICTREKPIYQPDSTKLLFIEAIRISSLIFRSCRVPAKLSHQRLCQLQKNEFQAGWAASFILREKCCKCSISGRQNLVMRPSFENNVSVKSQKVQ